MAALVGLAGCARQAPPGYAVSPYGGYNPVLPQGAVAEAPRARVAVLLPLSGAQAPLGQAMLNAATLALFEQGGPGVELVPSDTGGTAAGAGEAARRAVSEGARVVVGPLTGGETASVANLARGANLPVLAFTNDASVAGGGVWAMGLTPAQQVRRLLRSAQAAGVRRVALAAPEGPFGRQLAAALRTAASEAGMAAPLVTTYPQGALRSTVAQNLVAQAGTEPPGMVILGESGAQAREMAAALVAAGLAPPALRIAGHAQWTQDPSLASEPALAGALVPGPDPVARAGFEGRYQSAFGDRPPRLAAVAYDAASVAVRSLRGGPAAPAQLPVGEMVLGADGALRLLPDGQTQRALAVYALRPNGEPEMVEPAQLPGAAGS